MTLNSPDYSFLESGPPINSPWNNSQFLSHSLLILEKMPQTSLFAQYMNTTPTLGEYAPSVEGAGYTIFAPTDEAFAALELEGPGTTQQVGQCIHIW